MFRIALLVAVSVVGCSSPGDNKPDSFREKVRSARKLQRKSEFVKLLGKPDNTASHRGKTALEWIDENDPFQLRLRVSFNLAGRVQSFQDLKRDEVSMTLEDWLILD